MKRWTDWETIRRRVAIAGRVFDREKAGVAGAQVRITSMPEAFRRRMEGFLGAAARRRGDPEKGPDETASRWDGVYYFLDLPAGKYTLTAVDGRTGDHDEKSVTVEGGDSGSIAPARVDFELSP